ncbi:hypothetical protein GPL09_13975 [Bacteroides thetaiotaomicron]|nr:hypothetical protein [Bacteroides thetaiotaomicron]
MEKEMLKKEAKKPLSPSWHSTSYTQLSRKQVNRPRSLFTHEIRFMVLFIILSCLFSSGISGVLSSISSVNTRVGIE